MMKKFTRYLKSLLVLALALVLSFHLFSFAVNISGSVAGKIAKLILIEQILGPNSDFLFGLIMVLISVVSILILYKIYWNYFPRTIGESENNADSLKEIVICAGFTMLCGFAYPFNVQSFSIALDLFFNALSN